MELALWTGAAALAWLLAAGLTYLRLRPCEPPVGAKTLELGPESPAVANFLVNSFRVGRQAAPATLLDLAARDVLEVEQRGQGVLYVRLRPTREMALTAYEERVLDHVRRRVSNGVLPAQALTTGPSEESRGWWRGFEREVVADAKERGLSRDALTRRLFGALWAASLIPAVPAGMLGEFETGAGVMFGALMLLSWIFARHPQRETARGLEAAGRWRGVRAALAENEQFGSHSPFTIELWDRLLAYGAALGVARAAAGPLAMGTESDTRAWTAHGGRWREVRVAYPRLWPLAWGRHPLAAAAVGAGVALGPSFLVQAGLFRALIDIGGVAILFAVGLCAVITAGVVVVAIGLADVSATREISGPVLRLRVFGDENHRRLYMAIDDGASSRIRALRVRPELYAQLSQGETVTAQVTPRLRYVRSISGPAITRSE